MSLALIQESAKEVRRLAIAGGPLAVGDFRLKKLVASLEQAGAKVPVFAQVAKAISDLVNGNEAESASRLLSLSTLLNAILYTQGQTSAGGDFRELETFPTNCTSTRTTARLLKPLMLALTSSGGGRFETIKSAVERGAFNDLRLIDPAIQALGDNYPELADLVAEKILPGYGPGIVPRLKSTLDLKGKRHEARKLTVMHQLDPAGTLELCKAALDDGSPEVKASAITCLGKHEECLPLVLEQANAKNKLLRVAALEALAEHDRPEVTKLFTDLVKGKALDLLVGPFRALRNRQVLNSLLEEGKRVFDLVLKGDSEQIARYWEILDCLQQRKDAEVEEFLLGCLANSDKLAKIKAPKNSVFGGADFVARLAVLLYGTGSPAALEALLAKRDTLPVAAFPLVLRAAIRSWTPERVYTEFAPLLAQKKGSGKDRIDQLEQVVRITTQAVGEPDYMEDVDFATAPGLQAAQWDERWLDAAIKADRQIIVACLAGPGQKAAIAYLAKQLEAKGLPNVELIIQALARCQYAKLTDAFLELVTKKTKNAKYLDYELQCLFACARYLSPSDLPKLDAFAAKLDEDFVDHFLVAIDPLRRTAASA